MLCCRLDFVVLSLLCCFVGYLVGALGVGLGFVNSVGLFKFY